MREKWTSLRKYAFFAHFIYILVSFPTLLLSFGCTHLEDSTRIIIGAVGFILFVVGSLATLVLSMAVPLYWATLDEAHEKINEANEAEEKYRRAQEKFVHLTLGEDYPHIGASFPKDP